MGHYVMDHFVMGRFVMGCFVCESKFHPLPLTIDNGGKPQINGKDLWQTADYR
jgi:hypothetical protein